MVYHFYLKCLLTHKLKSFRRGYLEDIFSNTNQVRLSFRRKCLAVFVANNKIQAFKLKLAFWENCMHQHESNSSPTLKDFSDEILMMLTYSILNLSNEMRQYLEDLHNSDLLNDQYFLNTQLDIIKSCMSKWYIQST